MYFTRTYPVPFFQTVNYASFAADIAVKFQANRMGFVVD
jgi:hypothetical protein